MKLKKKRNSSSAIFQFGNIVYGYHPYKKRYIIETKLIFSIGGVNYRYRLYKGKKKPMFRNLAVIHFMFLPFSVIWSTLFLFLVWLLSLIVSFFVKEYQKYDDIYNKETRIFNLIVIIALVLALIFK